MEIKSFLTGKRGVSLPFTDECRPIAQNNEKFQHLTKFIFEYGKKAGWKHVELRGNHNALTNLLSFTSHYTHVLDLDKSENMVFSSFKSNVKRNIKRAQKEGLQITLSNTWESMMAFYRLNCMTRKQHGLPPQPLSFFKKIFEHVISPQNGLVVQAFFQMKPIAAAVYYHFGNHAVYKYGASDRKYLNLRPNNLVMWEAIKYYVNNGFQHFSFGRTEPENHGLLQFKRAWETREETLNYYKYDLKQDCFVSKESKLKTSYNLLKYIPSPLLRLTGSLLYRHVG
jgi:lipid II:glycine glycyltransferase (peptidoglycan interpeptide bridge formation enzyme)